MPSKKDAKTKSALKRLRSLWLPITSAVVLLSCIILLAATSSTESCEEQYSTDKRIVVGLASLNAEVADNDASRQVGLSGKDCIPANTAMLFIFDEPAKYAFWMKDMRFPIDIVWLDAARKVVHIEQAVDPETYPKTFTSNEPALYVLELRSGRATELGLQRGSTIVFR